MWPKKKNNKEESVKKPVTVADLVKGKTKVKNSGPNTEITRAKGADSEEKGAKEAQLIVLEKRYKGKVEGWIYRALNIGGSTQTTLTVAKMKQKGPFLKWPWHGQTFTITTPPLMVFYTWYGIPMVKSVYLIDEDKAVTIAIEKGQDKTKEGSKEIKWSLSSYLLDEIVNSGLFTQIWKQFKISPGQVILMFLMGGVLGMLIGGLFL
jgi:hypothetical protein